MKKYILLIFAVSFICASAPTYAFDFSEKTKDTLSKGGGYKSPLGNPLKDKKTQKNTPK